ncbi:hypothetical protein [Antricoccus suffuscus]|uniref:hypothetical protein n=1 Tax=Antricoccus suffuscus TaxID=1629062 RepID=UPI0011B29D2A|nr:hypothetical protein [Antricoccus suffuscus]
MTTAARSSTDPTAASKTPITVAAPVVPAATQVPPTPVPSPVQRSDDAPSAAVASNIDIPIRVLTAYMNAADAVNSTHPGCHLQWQFLAALGEIESHHGRVHGSSVGADGVVSPSIYGPALDGSVAGVVGSIADSGGQPARAMGPMQFIPSTWAVYGNGSNPQDIDDAALAAANYECADGRDLGTEAGRYAAALSYNHADWYAANVLAIYADYVAEKPGLSRPETPPPGADPAANATIGQGASPVPAAPVATPQGSGASPGSPFTTSATTPPTPATSTSTPAPTTSPTASPTGSDPPLPSASSASPPSPTTSASTTEPSTATPSSASAGTPSPTSSVPIPAA